MAAREEADGSLLLPYLENVSLISLTFSWVSGLHFFLEKGFLDFFYLRF